MTPVQFYMDVNVTGNLTAVTQTTGNSSTRAATTAFVQASLDALIDSAPGTLNTLGEIATALEANDDALGALTDAIALKAPIAGPTFTGAVTLGGAPTVDLHAATKLYVDTAVAGAAGAVGKYTETIGDAAATTFTVNHLLGSQDVTYSLRDATTNKVVNADVIFTDANNIALDFGVYVPANAGIKVVVLG